MIEQSKEVGATTLEVLQRQREQIVDIDTEVTGIGSNLKKAEKLINNFAKRLATDRLIQVHTVGICLGYLYILCVLVLL